MFTKELDNIAKSLPSFLIVFRRIENPLTSDKPTTDLPLDTVAKSLWAVLPCHIGAFFGLSELSPDEALTVVMVGLLALVLLMWVGVGLGYFHHRADAPEMTDSGQSQSDLVPSETRGSRWVSALVVTWFFAVAFLTALNIVFLLINQAAGYDMTWPNIRSEVEVLVPWPPLPTLTGLAALVGALSVGWKLKGSSGATGKNFVFVGICAVIVFLLLLVCGILLSP